MMKSKLGMLVVVLVAGSLSIGCVTTKRFEETVNGVTTRVDGVQTKVEQQSARIDKLEAKDGELAGDISRVGTEVGAVRGEAANAMTAAKAAEKAARGKVIWQVTLSNNDVRFGTDKYEITDTGRGALDELVSKLKGMDRMVFVEIQGHTDARGSKAYNQVLGERRAEAARQYLRDQGIPLNLMSVVSYGSDKPIAENKTSDGRAQNRRVEILVLE